MTQQDKDRADFEAWARNRLPLTVYVTGGPETIRQYANTATVAAWDAWQAARESAQQPVAHPTSKDDVPYPYLPKRFVIAPRNEANAEFRAEHRDEGGRLVIGGSWLPTRQAATAEAWAIHSEAMHLQQQPDPQPAGEYPSLPKPCTVLGRFVDDKTAVYTSGQMRAYVDADRKARGQPLSDDQIRAVFLANGFSIKEGQTDLKPYVYDAARALLAFCQPSGNAADEPGWLQRLRLEQSDLRERQEKLEAFIARPAFRMLDEDSRNLLERQFNQQHALLQTLNQRLNGGIERHRRSQKHD